MKEKLSNFKQQIFFDSIGQDENIEVIMSNKGNPMLQKDSFLYSMKYNGKESSTLHCRQAKSKIQCKCFIKITKGNIVVSDEHNHDEENIEDQKIRNEAKKIGVNSPSRILRTHKESVIIKTC